MRDKPADGEHHDFRGAHAEARGHERMRHLMQQNARNKPSRNSA